MRTISSCVNGTTLLASINRGRFRALAGFFVVHSRSMQKELAQDFDFLNPRPIGFAPPETVAIHGFHVDLIHSP
jgi:hypothetical protein